MRFTAFLAFPLLFGFGMVAQEFIVLTIGEKWLESARLLQLLCISGAFIPICSVLTNMLISKGKSGTYFWVTLVLCVTLIATMQVLYPYGIRTMVIAYVIIYVLWTLVWHFFVSRLTGYTLWALLLDIMPFAVIALGVMAATWWGSLAVCHWLLADGTWQLALLLAMRIVMAVVLYYVVMRLLRVKILEECMNFLRKK
jgi:O-antigen/teichoic acid export membrane protein